MNNNYLTIQQLEQRFCLSRHVRSILLSFDRFNKLFKRIKITKINGKNFPIKVLPMENLSLFKAELMMFQKGRYYVNG